MTMKKIDRTGEVGINRQGLEMKIVEYKNNKEVRVVFVATGETRMTSYLKFKQGKVFPTWRNRKGVSATPKQEDCGEVDSTTSGALGVALAVGLLSAFAMMMYVLSLLV